MAIRVDEVLRNLLEMHQDDEDETQNYRQRKRRKLEVLKLMVEHGNAEEKVDPDGRKYWRATQQLRERLAEDEHEAIADFEDSRF